MPDPTYGPAFQTTREELWKTLVMEVPSYFTITEGEFGPGRDYHTLNRDLFEAIRRFCDMKEAQARG